MGESDEPLPGALFGLFRADEAAFVAETALAVSISDADGRFSFDKIPYGNWLIREIAAPEGYVLSDEVHPVTIAENGVVLEIKITNERIRGNVQLTKVDKDYPENKLSGAEFELYADSNGNGEFDSEDALVGMLQELTGGIYQMNDLLFGGYFVKEKTAPQGFYLDENAYYFQITEDGQTVTVENEAGKGFLNNAQRGSIRIEKSSDDGVIHGFTFKVEGTDFTGQPYSQTFVTDEKGEIHIEGLRIGTYTISEVKDKASERYELPPDETVTLQAGMTTVVKCFNKSIQDGPDIPKTGDESNIAMWGTVALAALAGAGVVSFVLWKKSRKK